MADMKTQFAFVLFFCGAALSACTTTDDKTLAFECHDQNTGDACYKLSLKKTGEEAAALLKRGCELGSSKACEAQKQNETKAATP